MPTTLRRCPVCRAEVRSGDDDLGIAVIVELRQLDPIGELEAILGGRRTYTLYLFADSLAHRSAGRIVRHPAGTRPRTTVHPAHEHEGRP